jgi:hypothetical protein
MKAKFRLILPAFLIAGLFLIASCGASEEKTDETEEQVESTEDVTMGDKTIGSSETEQVAAYACPMHPKITGNEDDKCSECGMALEKVEKEEMADAYACPMHPEETGKAGDKCSKCKMDLEKVEKEYDHSEDE